MSQCCNAQVEKVEAPQVHNQYHLPTIVENLEKDLDAKKGLIQTLSADVEIIVSLINKIRELV